MNANIKGALAQINKCWRWFEHNGEKMTKNQVRKVLEHGIAKGYDNTGEIPDEEIDKIINEIN